MGITRDFLKHASSCKTSKFDLFQLKSPWLCFFNFTFVKAFDSRSISAAMARRTYTTELGCIACEELGDFGAGKEGWLVNNPNLLCALDSHSLALANRSVILVLGWSGSDGYQVKIRPSDLSPIEAEHISALEWLVFDEVKVILVGTSCGYLIIYSLRGELILKQVVSHSYRF